MLKKRIIAGILNVKHTIIDDIKTFDDESDIVINVHPSKGQQVVSITLFLSVLMKPVIVKDTSISQ
ncbi:MAG: hypothetical protein MJZ11_06990 [Lachnospiraceae bacterium]|nr:hypothetical protein [Lachnospiraceae bacterium]